MDSTIPSSVYPPKSVSCVEFPSSSTESANPSSNPLYQTSSNQAGTGFSQRLQAIRPPHLPFRRISLPTQTSLPQRHSVASVGSFDSLPEGGQDGITTPGTGQTSALGVSKLSLTSSSTSLAPPAARRAEGARRQSIESARRDREKEREKQRGRHKGRWSEANASLPSVPQKVREAREAKRRKIVQEFYDTEKSYVGGLDFIYHHFLSPIIASLETPDSILDRTSLTNLFSNFIDIWNLHKSFFDALSEHLTQPITDENSNASMALESASSSPPPLSPILLSHFPYLSLYTPFITAFPSILSTLSDLTAAPSFSNHNPHYSKPFTEFLSKQESDPKCGKLKFRDWMLTIVQRCPRYLLLLRDLRACIEPAEDGEYEKLGSVLDLVSKITNSLNVSLQTHAQTLSLISLQRSTSNLPFPLIVPGRTLLKRGPLYQIDRSEPAREREFLLFSDCLIWLARSGDESDWGWGRRMFGNPFIGGGSSNWNNNPTEDAPDPTSRIYRFGNRIRSMSDANLPLPPSIRRGGQQGDAARSTPSSPQKARFPQGAQSPPLPMPLAKRHSTASSFGSGSGSGSGSGVDEKWVYKCRLELVDVEVVVASEWGGEQRRFEILSPEGSFALYAGTEHDRDEWVSVIRHAKAQVLVSLNATNPNSTLTSSSSTHHVRRLLQALPFPPENYRLTTLHEGSTGKRNSEKGERRSRVEHWVPAIWVPDEKTRECMRCGQTFGWRRRRHHCRLCGRCVCATCSAKTFYIADLDAKDGSSKPARACNICYETVFPILEDSDFEDYGEPSSSRSKEGSNSENNAQDTITSLSNFSAWMSKPSRPTSVVDSTPQALMGIEFERGIEGILSRSPSEHGSDEGRKARVRLRSQNSRPVSYMQVLEGFGESRSSDRVVPNATQDEERRSHSPFQNLENIAHQRKTIESTVRKRKRFSLPALAIQPLNVTARTILANGSTDGSLTSSTSVAGGRFNPVAKRSSLVFSGRNHSMLHLSGSVSTAAAAEGATEKQDDPGPQVGGVMGRLSDLLKGSRARS
ncbi:hypothetical protein M378DRAFT_399735 [Amanita muscaria Koide BX008]|uniref:Uncharacterized protein n=1 Tax=Amanita muscaria (strain Koide BX008) TaxID=946122 RepID=A0A0C2S3H8_AMAMK|nr:hypothetical protein M378DRAFT_399735 [Amanita muscaria Koide BX008]